MNAPVAVGGVGGSGTRVVADVLQRLDVYLGSDLNRALDNLWFTFLFKRPEILGESDAGFDALTRIFRSVMRGDRVLSDRERSLIWLLSEHDRVQHPSAWLRTRALSLIERGTHLSPPGGRWGWKEPNTHIVAERLMQSDPDLRYIHVVRNGLDMAFSLNQNQLRLWGRSRLDGGVEATPRESLTFWCQTHRRMLAVAAKAPGRTFFLSYDRLCAEPSRVLQDALDFLEMAVPESLRRILPTLVRPSATIGRYKAAPRELFDPADVAFVESQGFDTTY